MLQIKKDTEIVQGHTLTRENIGIETIADQFPIAWKINEISTETYLETGDFNGDGKRYLNIHFYWFILMERNLHQFG